MTYCIDYQRRTFLKKSISLVVSAAISPILGRKNASWAQKASGTYPDLVMVKNGMPDVMLDKALPALGGMERFVKKGQTVVIKPNIGWEKVPKDGGNTNPMLVKRIIEQCKHAGAKKIYVFDHSVEDDKKCYQKSGIEAAANAAGAMVVPANHEKNYHEVEIPGAVILEKTKVHELILEADTFINVPILKNHFATRLTIGLKNMMGIVWDRSYFHHWGLDYAISDLSLFRKPDLNIIDAYRVTMKNGPHYSTEKDTALKKTLLVSKDIVAGDSAAAQVFGISTKKIRHIKMAHEKKIGNMNLAQLKIKTIEL